EICFLVRPLLSWSPSLFVLRASDLAQDSARTLNGTSLPYPVTLSLSKGDRGAAYRCSLLQGEYSRSLTDSIPYVSLVKQIHSHAIRGPYNTLGSARATQWQSD